MAENEIIKFFPETKAKSSEVNYNFDELVSRIDTINQWKDEIDNKFKGNAGLNLFDTKVTDHILEGADAQGWLLQGSLVTEVYPDAVIAIQKYYNNGIETTYRGVPCKQASNKMYIADITQKNKIDELFNTTGIADFYIWDALNKQFYLPRNKYFYQLTLDTSTVNNFNDAGLPNITGSTNTDSNTGETLTGAFYGIPTTGGYIAAGSSGLYKTGFDASLLNPIYGNSDTVQPPSSNKLLYYKVGDVVINETSIDVEQVLNDLQNIQNGVFSDVGKAEITGWGFPSDRYEDLTLLATGQKYEAKANGYFCFRKQTTVDSQCAGYVYDLNDTLLYVIGTSTARNVSRGGLWIPVLKGYKVQIDYDLTGTLEMFRFIYAEGAK